MSNSLRTISKLLRGCLYLTTLLDLSTPLSSILRLEAHHKSDYWAQTLGT